VEEPWQDDITAATYKYIIDQIDQLPEQMKKVFKMSYIEGLTNEEIAQSLKINNQSVRNHKARALKILRLSIPGKDMLEMMLLLLPLFKH
jgi:RNA polymerase sigma-70 factor (ECF subfamily)